MNNILIFTFIGELYFYVSTPDEIKKWSIRKRKPSLLSLTVNISVISLSNLTTKGQFQNQLLLRIPKLSLVVTFDKEMMEIFTVKEKASIYKLTTFLFCWVYIRRYTHGLDAGTEHLKHVLI